ncbi:hypothetical protein [Chthonobacter rhizosphaerae]|uniref:hypothetical protein n=1 Tax=Chthonobacter rhizosphaerae TaxID=2735553 RepID=UPI0015EF1087|nr:hypothetical protein [Chthonobacter rhizosphaerae]
MLDEERRSFVTSPVMIILAGRGADLQPSIGRGLGARVTGDDAVEIVVSEWQWPQAVADIRRTGAAAATFARPADYVSYQVKGAAAVRPAMPADTALADRYLEEIGRTLADLGLQPALVAPWFVGRGHVVVRLKILEIYVQTPGRTAGLALGGAS